ncbi:MAG TPA: adenylosuccinate lyase [Candidatus Omnitrophota bacterium]|nr:MAG: Adenylosuccinate lyase [Candidatus Omnitrophica bacterium ADurb.Bin314]HOE68671.1 adenylosuccinate lyase [Candidatus Omnitrophota bacterium]HQB94051.1 adenylosuccinate lyase [Candidatus Omnitrophota bacterium]
MIPRYTRPEMAKVWTEENKLQKWLEVELAALDGLARYGYIPKEIPAKVRPRAKFDVARVKEIEKITNHDVIAFLTNVAEHVGPAGRYVHFGLTSSDILDTGLALQLVDASRVLNRELRKLIDILAVRARAHANTLMVGRSHGVHAEPVTFGLKMALFHAEFKRNLERFERATENIRFGKISGAVGTFANVAPKVENYVCKKLKLNPAPVSTQILQRDRHAEYMTVIAVIGGSLEKLATEIRGLQKTECYEVQEYFAKGQKGSSAMPHKRNPITCERIAGLARILRGNALAALENIALWHERDITHSSVERVIFPDSTILLDYMLGLMQNVIENLQVNKDRMLRNMEASRGMVFSQGLLLKLVEKGLTREDAYKLVQAAAKRIWEDESANLRDVALSDKGILEHLSPAEVREAFSYDRHLRNVPAILKRAGILKNK